MTPKKHEVATPAVVVNAIERFREAFKDSAEKLAKAAEVYYAAIIEHPTARDAFAKAFPQIPSSFWANMARVGSGEMDCRLLLDATPGGRALTYCDSATQAHYLANPVPMAVVGAGKGDSMLVSIDKMTSEQCRQVFNRGAVRDLAEQRAWIETQKTRAAIVNPPAVDPVNDVFVKGGLLHVGGVKLDRKQLLKYLTQMEG
jgi:hypothetical protein